MGKPQVNSRPQTGFRRLLTADASPMEVTATLQADLKIQGLIIPFSFLVIDKLGYDCIHIYGNHTELFARTYGALT
jgi:hypothetical protein